MTALWKNELDRFSSLLLDQKVLWLSSLLFYLSILARDTYKPGSELVIKSTELRRYNELVHRIADKQLSLVGKDSSSMPDEQLFSIISDELQNLGVDCEGLVNRLR